MSRRARPASPRPAAHAEETITAAEDATAQPAGSHGSPKCRYATQLPAPRSASVAAMVSVVVRAVSM